MRTQPLRNFTQLLVPMLLPGSTFFFAACSGNQGHVHSVPTEKPAISSADTMATGDFKVYRLYRETIKDSIDQPSGLVLFEEFKKIYQQHGVKVIGEWGNTDNPKEYYFMTAYRDENHYRDFVNAMKENTRYQEMGKILASERESIEVVRLKDVH